MKRIFLTAAASLLCAVSVLGQTQKIDFEGFNKKIAKSDQDIADPKKNTKATTWLNRGAIFFDAAEAPSKGVFAGMTRLQMNEAFGDNPASKPVANINKVKYSVNSYPGFMAYMADGKLFAWHNNVEVYEGSEDKAVEAYAKAYQLDPKQEQKAKDGIGKVVNLLKSQGDNALKLQQTAEAAAYFQKVYEMSQVPPMSYLDTTALYRAGVFYTSAGDYEKALPNLLEAIKQGVYDNGNIQYYIFHCYYNAKDYVSARAILIEGIKLFPNNTQLIEALVAINSMVPGADPNEVIPIVTEALEKDPKNADLWSGLGNIYAKLEQPDKAIEAFTKASELAPTDFVNFYNLGNLYLGTAERLTKELNSSLEGISVEDYTVMRKNVEDAYGVTIPYFEKALELDKTGNGKPVLLRLLSRVTFILRDSSEDMMNKYNKYNEELKSLEEAK